MSTTHTIVVQRKVAAGGLSITTKLPCSTSCATTSVSRERAFGCGKRKLRFVLPVLVDGHAQRFVRIAGMVRRGAKSITTRRRLGHARPGFISRLQSAFIDFQGRPVRLLPVRDHHDGRRN